MEMEYKLISRTQRQLSYVKGYGLQQNGGGVAPEIKLQI